MRAPLFNGEHGSLPAQEATAATQHPALAPRPFEFPPVTYHSTQQPGSGLSEAGQTLSAPQFYYPSPPVQAPSPSWANQPKVVKQEDYMPSDAIYDPYFYQSQYTNSGSSNAQYRLETGTQYQQQALNQANNPGQDYSSVPVTTVYIEQPDDSSHSQISPAQVRCFPRRLLSLIVILNTYSG